MEMAVDDEDGVADLAMPQVMDSDMSLLDDADLPTSLIITNVADCVFDEDRSMSQFEEVFRSFEENATFQRFKNFHRIRVNYSTPTIAASARIKLHETDICGTTVKCYFVQQRRVNNDDEPFLKPPKPTKQFLISPPASPPVGWEQPLEAQPLVNYDLLAAIAGLAPGCSHELHPETTNNPSIVVHTCPDGLRKTDSKPKIVQTRCPSRSSSGT